jgi:hypothetical protein
MLSSLLVKKLLIRPITSDIKERNVVIIVNGYVVIFAPPTSMNFEKNDNFKKITMGGAKVLKVIFFQI